MGSFPRSGVGTDCAATRNLELTRLWLKQGSHAGAWERGRVESERLHIVGLRSANPTYFSALTNVRELHPLQLNQLIFN